MTVRTTGLYAKVRVSEDDHHFLLNPFGLLYHEITASSLIKVDVQVSQQLILVSFGLLTYCRY